MNIEVANRLQQLRKAKGLSQEELANILGLSRQAISKWERAETSPDTDNLICLARLYNISIDKLLDTSESTEEIKERIAQERINEINREKEEKETGEDDIVEPDETIEYIEDAEIINDSVEYTKEEAELRQKRENREEALGFSFIGIGVLAYVLTGIITDDWSWGWPLIFVGMFTSYFLTQLFVDRTLSGVSLIFAIGFSCIIFGDTTNDDESTYLLMTFIFFGLLFLAALIPIITFVIFNLKNRKELVILNEKDELKRLQEKCKKIIEANENYKKEIKDINK